ncbi:MAG: SDR family NAD(P)-dependent oxidoreductase [Neisseria sp.]|nr:SDR family NAD(P)-dependent oxidoreductase [Neisseria sp.]
MKKWLIIGASRGMGAALASYAAERGVSLVLAAAADSMAELDTQLAEIRSRSSAQVGAVTLDMTAEPAVILKAMQEAEAVLGGLDCIWINGGIIGHQTLDTLDVALERRIIEVNLSGVIACIHAAVALFDGRDGHIAVSSSIAAVMPFAHAPAYGASKAAVSTYCENIRKRLKRRKISLTLLHPGFIRTDMVQAFGHQVCPLLMSSKERAVAAIFRALMQRKTSVYIPTLPWLPLMMASRLLPAAWLRRLLL